MFVRLSLAHARDLAMRAADLETLLQFMQAKARRPRPFIPDPTATEPRMDWLALFADEQDLP